MKRLFTLLLSFLTFIYIFSGCKSIREAKNFSDCEFELSSIKSVRLVGVNVLGLSAFTDLNPLEAGQLLLAFKEKKIPFTIDLVIKVTNPNNKKASLSKLDWIAQIDDLKIAEGTIKDKVEIEPMGSANMPVRVEADLVELFSQKSSMDVFLKLINVFGDSKKSSSFIFKAKPYLEVGKKLIKVPGYIKVKQKL